MPGPSGAPPYPVYAQGITFAQPAVDELRPQKRPRARPSSSSSSLTDVRRPSRDSLEPPTASSSAGEKKGKVKLPLSCGECRRLKLKCDRVFPCQSCVKRGCAEICPDGSLISGKGSRFILANTEQLHDKIVTMSERIRVLEEALNQAHISSSSSSQPHALLAPDLLSLKSSIELYGSAHSALSSADSSTRDSSDGPPTRPSTSSHTVQWSDEAASDSTDLSLSVNVLAQPLYPTARAPVPPSVPQDLAHLSACFPLPWTTPTGHADTRARIRDFLPPREEAHALCAEAQESAMWQHNPDPSESFLADLVEHAYTAPVEALSPHRLATVFMILAIGGTVDLRPGASTDAELYYHLARVAMCDYPLAGDANADSVTALVFMLWYLLVFNDRKGSVTMAWEIMGVAARTAQSIDLHRDGARWKFPPDEIQRRRALFWELVSLDARISLSLSRPPAFPPQYFDTKRPTLSGPSYPTLFFEWKHHFLSHCLHPVLELLVAAPAPKYTTVTSVDAVVRDSAVPAFLRLACVDDRGVPAGLIMQRAHVSMGRDILLLQLHRSFFTETVNRPEMFVSHHPYLVSAAATVYSACQMISCMETVYGKQPALASRFTYFWSSTMAGALSLCVLMSRVPFCAFVPLLRPHLESCLALFRRASSSSPKAEQCTPLLEEMVGKANLAYTRWCEGLKAGPADEVPGAHEHPALAGRTELGGGGSLHACDSDAVQGSVPNMHRTLARLFDAVQSKTATPAMLIAPPHALPEPAHAQGMFAPWGEFSYGMKGIGAQQQQQQQSRAGLMDDVPQVRQSSLAVHPSATAAAAAAAAADRQTSRNLDYIQNIPPQMQDYFITSSGAQLSAMYESTSSSSTSAAAAQPWMDMF